MAAALAEFETEVARNPDLLEKCFGRCFSVAEMVKKAEDLGYSFDYDDLELIESDIRQTPTEAKVTFIVVDADTGKIRELTIDEIELVSAGTSPYTYANIATTMNIVNTAAILIYVTAVAGALVVASVGVAVAVFV